MTEDPKALHPGIAHIMQFFKYEHLPKEAQWLSSSCKKLAEEMVSDLPRNPELTTGLRKLLEAKDCFVRAKIAANQE